ncbi:MAG TPA: OsmC family protein [Paracoccaceae bacterium]|nr:OsmC family protein [Paracoccaceae bacterium]
MAGNASHGFEATVRWTGNAGTGTSAYTAYRRTHEIEAAGKPAIPASADPAFRGDADRWNPEEMLIGAIASCHMLWFLHLASVAGVIVETYEDRATAEMRINPDGSGEFTSATLRPHVTVSAGDAGLLPELHGRAHEKCFIARSLNFEVACEPVLAAADTV